MATIWALGEVNDGVPSKLTLELATLARQLAEKSGGESKTVLIGKGASGAASEVAAYADAVVAVDVDASGPTAATVAARAAALIAEHSPDFVLLPASNDGKDVAGLLLGLTDLPVLVNAAAVDWADDGPQVEMSTYGGKLVTCQPGMMDIAKSEDTIECTETASGIRKQAINI